MRTLLGRTPAGRLLPRFARRRIGIQFLLQLPQLFFGFFRQRLFQRRLTTEGSRTCTGSANLHSVLRYAVQRHQPLGHQPGHALRQQAVQQFDVPRAKSRRAYDSSSTPRRKSSDRPRETDTSGSVPVHRPPRARWHTQPKAQQDSRVGWPTWSCCDGLNPFEQLRQIKAVNVAPDDPRLMVFGQQIVQRTLLKFNLEGDRRPQPLRPQPRGATPCRLGSGCDPAGNNDF